MQEPLTLAQRRTLPARQALARKFASPEAKSQHYREMAAKANAGRVVLSGREAAALTDVYRLLGRVLGEPAPSAPREVADVA